MQRYVSIALTSVLLPFAALHAGCDDKPKAIAPIVVPPEVASPTAAPTRAKAKDIDAPAAKALLADGKHRVLDVRTPEEFAAGHIAGAINININAPGFAEQAAKLPTDQPLVVHCAAGTPGGRSRRAVEALSKVTTAEILHLNGGIGAWTKAGYSVEK